MPRAMPPISASSSPAPPAGPGGAYRPEVDGLRALAVLAVVFFHVDLPWFQGGFVGVDVFFVISGYLITRLILGELEAGRFSFARFYGRRARRLFPAMFTTLAATFVASVFVLSPTHLEELALSLVHTLFSISNVLFWTLSGYFDTGAGREAAPPHLVARSRGAVLPGLAGRGLSCLPLPASPRRAGAGRGRRPVEPRRRGDRDGTDSPTRPST